MTDSSEKSPAITYPRSTGLPSQLSDTVGIGEALVSPRHDEKARNACATSEAVGQCGVLGCGGAGERAVRLGLSSRRRDGLFCKRSLHQPKRVGFPDTRAGPDSRLHPWAARPPPGSSFSERDLCARPAAPDLLGATPASTLAVADEFKHIEFDSCVHDPQLAESFSIPQPEPFSFSSFAQLVTEPDRVSKSFPESQRGPTIFAALAQPQPIDVRHHLIADQADRDALASRLLHERSEGADGLADLIDGEYAREAIEPGLSARIA